MNLHGFPLPVLALDLGEIFGVIILVLSVLGWFVKAIKGQNGNAAVPQARKRTPDLRRSEIETFLEEISGGQQRTPQARQAQPNRPVNKARPENAPAKKSGKSAKPAKTAKPIASLAQQHLAKSNVGEGLRAHVSNFVKGERIPAEVQQDLKNRIAAEVQADLGPSRLSAAPSVTTQHRPAHPLITLLRNPEGVRQAIALQEILQRPRALRRQ